MNEVITMAKSTAARRPLPVIGINCSSNWPKTEVLNPARALQNSLPFAYVRAVELAGGLPMLLPLVGKRQLIAQLVDEIDGLLLSGGVDVDPHHFGQSPHPKLGRQDVDKDRFESVLIPLALKKKRLPILGICRGIQALNVFCGGTLHQDVSLAGDSVLKHQQETDQSVPTHTLLIEPGTRLHRIFGKRRLRANSYHHQVVDKVAPGWVVSARTEDGLIEGIEKPGKRFLVGFQPHPELLVEDYPEFRKLFRALVDAARNSR